MAAAMVSPSPAWRGRSVVVARLFPSLPKKTAALLSRRLYFGPTWPEVMLFRLKHNRLKFKTDVKYIQ